MKGSGKRFADWYADNVVMPIILVLMSLMIAALLIGVVVLVSGALWELFS